MSEFESWVQDTFRAGLFGFVIGLPIGWFVYSWWKRRQK